MSTFLCVVSYSATFTATQTGNWTDAATWGGFGPPSTNITTDVIIIPSGINVKGGGNITNSGGGLLTVQGALNAATYTLSSGGPSTVNGGGIIKLTGNFVQSASWGGNTTMSVNLNVLGDFVFSGGRDLTINGNVTVAGALTQSNGGNLNINGDLSTGSLSKTGGGTTSISGNLSTTTSGVSVSGGSGYTVSGNSSITGNLSHTNGGNVVMSGTNTISGSITQSNSALTLGPTSATSMTHSGGNVSVSTLSLSGNYTVTGGTGFTASGPVSVGGSISVSSGPQLSFQSDLTVGGNVSFTGGSGMTVSGNTAISGAYSQTSTGGNTSSFNGTFSSASITLNGGAKMALNGVSNVGTITLSTGAGASLQGSSTSVSFSSISFGTGSGSICSANTSAKVAALGSPVNLVTCSTVLPIVLSDFNVFYSNGSFKINWSTLQEIDNDFFDIEFSLDSRNFVSVKNIKGAGTSYKEIDYFEEISGLDLGRNNVVYFRIKQTDYDGTFAYSYVLPVSLDGSQTMDLVEFFPNPTDGKLSILFNFDLDSIEESLVLEIYTVQGKKIDDGHILMKNINEIDLSYLLPGVYYLKINENLKIEKLVIY